MAATATRAKRPAAHSRRAAPKRATAAARPGFRSAEEMSAVLDSVLAAVDADEAKGSLLRAMRPRLRIACPDLGVTLNLSASERPGSFIEWSYGDDAAWKPKLELTMDSEVANAWLQGAESIPMAIARGRVACAGDARCALLYLPAAKLIGEHYRHVVRAGYPHLVI